VALQDPRPPTSPPSSQCRPSQRRLRASSPQRLLAPSALPLLCRVARLRQRSWVEAARCYSSGEEGAGGGAHPINVCLGTSCVSILFQKNVRRPINEKGGSTRESIFCPRQKNSLVPDIFAPDTNENISTECEVRTLTRPL
jgi:hypothetical protein